MARAGQGRGNVHLRDGCLRLDVAAGVPTTAVAGAAPVPTPRTVAAVRSGRPQQPAQSLPHGETGRSGRGVRGGLRALSRARALLSHAGGDTVEVGALIRAEVAAHASGARDRPTIAGPRVSRKARQIQSFALALHELTTDAVESGALTVETGRLDATWESSSTGADAGDGPGAGSRAVSPSIRRRRRAGATARS